MKSYSDDEENYSYSFKRMFTLIGEESFLYSSNYEFYAIYIYIDHNTNEFCIIKSKDSIVSASHKRVFNIDNLTANSINSGSSCEYVQLKTSQKSAQVALKKEDYGNSVNPISDQNLISTTDKIGIRKARSVPLYILYQQLRSYIV